MLPESSLYSKLWEDSSQICFPAREIEFPSNDENCYEDIDACNIESICSRRKMELRKREEKSYLRQSGHTPCKSIFSSRIEPDFFQSRSQDEKIDEDHEHDCLIEPENLHHEDHEDSKSE